MKEKYDFYGIENIGYLDIETSGLVADFDIMITWANRIRNIKTGKVRTEYDFIEPKDFAKATKAKNADLIDYNIVRSVIDSINDCDLVIGHWFVGKHRHDMPFIRTRAALNNIKGLPKHKQIRYGDTQKWGSLLYRLHSNGLASIADMFNIATKKTPLEPKVWKNACIGIPEDIKIVLHHNIKDVELTHGIHLGMEEYVPIAATYA